MELIVYHGSSFVVEKPEYGRGKEDNDYGSGFYTTEDIEKAKEWACINGSLDKAICNKYSLEMSGLNVMRLDDYGTLAWIAEIIAHRGAKSEITKQLGERIVAQYKVDTSNADVIIGYRADDSYIDVVEAFLSNQLTIDELNKLFQKGDLGEQVFIKSKKAFDTIKFLEFEAVKSSPDSHYGNSETIARREVHNFLVNREKAINIDGFTPNGIVARDVINMSYKYNKEYNYYSPEEETSKFQDSISKKGKGGYGLEM